MADCLPLAASSQRPWPPLVPPPSRAETQRLARPRRAALRGRVAASRPGAGGVVPHPPCRAGVTSLSPSRSSAAAPRSQTPPLPSPLPLPRRSPTSPRGFVTNLSQAHRVRSQTTTLAQQPPRAAATPPGPSVSASLICMPSCRFLGRASLEPGTDHSPGPQIIRNTQVESHQQLFFQRRRQRGARTSGAAGENGPSTGPLRVEDGATSNTSNYVTFSARD